MPAIDSRTEPRSSSSGSNGGTTQRHATVHTPLSDTVFLYTMTGTEALGQPFHYDLTLLCENFDLEAADLLGQNVTVQLQTAGHEIRYFNGIVSHFAYAGQHMSYALYRVTLRPWLWLLSHDIWNEVFRDATIPELVLLALKISGVADLEPTQLSGNYEKREFYLKYQESTFNFVSRWLEHAGIYYYFKHREGGHTLYLADDSTNGPRLPHYKELPYRPPTQAGREARDHIDEWRESRRVTAGRYALNAFDFTAPNTDLFAISPALTTPHFDGLAREEPSHYTDPKVGKHYARVRGEEIETAQTVFEGSGNVRGLTAGALFDLTGYPRKALNGEYCVIESSISVHAGEYEAGAGGEVQVRSHFRAIRSDQPFRPARRTPRPVVAGPQTAIVTGVAGSEICTEEYGRVKVHFHWDNSRPRDENSSHWVRVAQPWAGSGFGFQFVPRVGQEVLVDFLDGDPDQPVVTGSVYNRDHMPPFAPNQHPTQSGIRTRTSREGGADDCNELRFEDLAKNEEIYLQAQRNLRELVKHDHLTEVKHDQTNRVHKNQLEEIAGEQTLNVTGSRQLHIKGSQSVTIDGDKALAGVSGAQLAITGEYRVHASETITVEAPKSITLQCGGSSIVLTPDAICITAGGQAVLELKTSALLAAATGGKLNLDTDVVAESALGAQLKLDTGALLDGLQTTVVGRVSAEIQALSSQSTLKVDPTGATLLGMPMVKIN